MLKLLTDAPWHIFDHHGTVVPPMIRMLVMDKENFNQKPRDSPELSNTDTEFDVPGVQDNEDILDLLFQNESTNLIYNRKCDKTKFIRFLNTGRAQIPSNQCPDCMYPEGGHVALLSISDRMCLAPLYPLLVNRMKNATLLDIDIILGIISDDLQVYTIHDDRNSTMKNETNKNITVENNPVKRKSNITDSCESMWLTSDKRK